MGYDSLMSGWVSPIGIFLIATLPTLDQSCDDGDPGDDCPQCVADFALYNPAYEDDGVWEEEVTALKTLFDTYGWTYREINAADLNVGALGIGDTQQYRAFVAPGGYAWYRDRDVSSEGEEAIRSFVHAGGNYLGFCAGSYWTAETVSWAETASGGGGSYNVPDDYQPYAYDLELLTGIAQGPFGWTPWNGGTNASLEPVRIELENPTMAAIGLPQTTRFFYYGGPFFANLDPNLEGLEVWAFAQKPDRTAEEASTGDQMPTVIRYQAGSGHVILFSYHPEILIDSDEDCVELSQYIVEADLEWDTGDQSQEEINDDSSNIVHAALQLSANEEVTSTTGSF